jgi:hypothetical protein
MPAYLSEALTPMTLISADPARAYLESPPLEKSTILDIGGQAPICVYWQRKYDSATASPAQKAFALFTLDMASPEGALVLA